MRLTPPELEVLALMAEGRTNVGIAKRLFVTERTVETHVTSILAKLGVSDSEENRRRVLAVVTYLRKRRSCRPLIARSAPPPYLRQGQFV